MCVMIILYIQVQVQWSSGGLEAGAGEGGWVIFSPLCFLPFLFWIQPSFPAVRVPGFLSTLARKHTLIQKITLSGGGLKGWGLG